MADGWGLETKARVQTSRAVWACSSRAVTCGVEQLAQLTSQFHTFKLILSIHSQVCGQTTLCMQHARHDTFTYSFSEIKFEECVDK